MYVVADIFGNKIRVEKVDKEGLSSAVALFLLSRNSFGYSERFPQESIRSMLDEGKRKGVAEQLALW